jgi:hypothetical protein
MPDPTGGTSSGIHSANTVPMQTTRQTCVRKYTFHFSQQELMLKVLLADHEIGAAAQQ